MDDNKKRFGDALPENLKALNEINIMGFDKVSGILDDIAHEMLLDCMTSENINPGGIEFLLWLRNIMNQIAVDNNMKTFTPILDRICEDRRICED